MVLFAEKIINQTQKNFVTRHNEIKFFIWSKKNLAEKKI